MTELAATTQSADPETQINSAEPLFEIRLSAVKSGAKVLRGGTEISVGQAQAANIQVDDGIEVLKRDGQNEQSYSILDFSNDLEVELFSNTSVFLNGLRQGAGGSTEITLHLDRGHLFVHPNEQTDSRVTVQTINATIKTLTAGAEFDVCQNDELTCVLVTKGVIEITAKGKKNILKAGEAGFVLKNETSSPPICAPLSAFILWEDRFRLFADTSALNLELSPLKQSPCPVTASGLPFDARILYVDEFRHPSSGWDQGQIDSFMVRYVRLPGRRYYEVKVQGPNDQYFAFVPNGRQYEDVNIDVRVVAEASSSGDFRYGTVFRRLGNQYYAFVISPHTKTWYFLKSSSTRLEVLREGTDTSMRDLESRNVLRVETYGSTFLLFINGRFIDWISDPDYVSGEVGLFAETLDNPDALIRFDSIIIWNVPPVPLIPDTGGREYCLNGFDDDDDRLVDRSDPDCLRLGRTAIPAPLSTDISTSQPTSTSRPTGTATPQSTSTPRPTLTTLPPRTSTSRPTLTTLPPRTNTPRPTLTNPPPRTNTPRPTLTSPPPRTSTPRPTLTSLPPRTNTPRPTLTNPPPRTSTPRPTLTSPPPPTNTPRPTSTNPPPTNPPPTDPPTTEPPPTDPPPTDPPTTEPPPTDPPPTDPPTTEPPPTDPPPTDPPTTDPPIP